MARPSNTLAKPTPIITPDVWLTDYTIGDEGGKQTVMGKVQLDSSGQSVPGTGGETYIVWDAKNKRYTPVYGIDAARRLVLEGAGANVRKLKESLLRGRFISKVQFNRDDYNEGLNEAIRTYSVSVLQDYQLRAPSDPKAKFGQTFSTYLGTMSSGSGSGSGSKAVTDQTQESTSLSTRVENNRRLEKYMVNLTGQVPTADDYAEYDDAVGKAERKAKVKVTTESDRSVDGTKVDTKQSVLGGQLGEDEYFVMAAKVGVKTLTKMGGNPELLKKLVAGGTRAAQDMSALKKHANDQGISLTDNQALEYVTAGLGKPLSSGQDNLSTARERINQTAITFYANNKALADHISKGGTYKDISDIYGAMKSKKLGIVIPNSTADDDVRRAIAAGMSASDFDRDLQSKPAWMETDEAHQIAGGYLDTILSKFGFAG